MTIKRRLRKLVNTRKTIEQQYLQYPDLDDINFWIYLPNKKGTTKKFVNVNTNPEKGLLLDRLHAHRLSAFNINALVEQGFTFTIYGSKDDYAVICNELNTYLFLKGLGELQAFMTTGKNHVIQYITESDKINTEKVFAT
jgi:hypothetical protein